MSLEYRPSESKNFCGPISGGCFNLCVDIFAGCCILLALAIVDSAYCNTTSFKFLRVLTMETAADS